MGMKMSREETWCGSSGDNDCFVFGNAAIPRLVDDATESEDVKDIIYHGFSRL